MHFYNVNVLSGVRLARHYAPGMTEQGWGGLSLSRPNPAWQSLAT